MSFLIGIFLLAGCVWILPFLRLGRVLPLAIAVLGLGTIVGPSFFYLQGPIQLSVDRILWCGLMGFLFLGLRLGHTRFPKIARTDYLVAGITGWFLISAVTGGPALPDAHPIAPWLFYIALPAGLYLAARFVTVTKQDVQLLTNFVLGLAVYLSVTAICEWRGWHGVVFPRYIVDPTHWEFFGRARGPLLQPAGNGVLFGMALAAAIARFMTASRPGKVGMLMLSLLILVGMYATLTRSVWMGAALVMGLFGFLYSPRWVRVLGLIAGVLLTVSMFLGLKEQLTNLKRDKELSAEDAAKSVQLRPLLAVVALEMAKDKPLRGHGLGRYAIKSEPYHANTSYGLPLSMARGYIQHNVLLSILVDTGLIGCMLFLAWCAVLAFAAWRLIREPTYEPEMRTLGLVMLGFLAAYWVNGMFHDVTVVVMIHSFLFFLGGVTVSVSQQGRLPQLVPSEKRRAEFELERSGSHSMAT